MQKFAGETATTDEAVDRAVNTTEDSNDDLSWHPEHSQTLHNFFSPQTEQRIFESAVTTPATIDLLENDRFERGPNGERRYKGRRRQMPNGLNVNVKPSFTRLTLTNLRVSTR